MQFKFFIYFLCFLFLSIHFDLSAQSSQTSSGQVVDGRSGEPLVGASVFTADMAYGTTTDEYGRYTLKVDSVNTTLISSYIGFQSDTCLGIKSQCFFELKIESLEEVIVKAHSNIGEEIGKLTPTMEQVKALPALFGDVDILKAMTLLPGVSGGAEGFSGMLVRGGNLSHNLIMLDGTPVYNSNHLFGMMSSFNPDAIKHVELYKSGFPAQYGGRLASVLNITMKDGNMKKYETKLSLGLINSSVVTEGPIWKDRISYMVAGRMFSLSPILGVLSLSEGRSQDWIYDLNTKLKFKIAKKQSLYFSFLQGRDKLSVSSGKLIKTKTQWGNSLASIRYNNQLSNSIFLDAGLYYNNYLFQSGQEVTVIKKDGNEKQTYQAKSSIKDLTAKLKARWVISPRYRLLVGGEYSQKTFKPLDFKEELMDSLGTILKSNEVFEELPTRNTILFVDNEFSLSNQLKIKLGVRGIDYWKDNYNFRSADLRASASYQFGKHKLKLAYDEMNQPFHLLTTVGSRAANEVWIPAASNIRPSKSSQISLGYSLDIPKWKSLLSVEVYSKKMTELVRYKPGAAYVFTQKNDWRNSVINSGLGKAKGVELFINKTEGRLTGWLGYTLAWSKRKYKLTNHGEWFASNYDRRHDLELTANYKLGKKWSVSSAFLFSTGRPLTLPAAYYLVPSEPGGVLTRYNIVFDKINDSRTKDYHRLDISFKYKKKSKRGRDVMWTFGAYNAYARNNPFSYSVALSEDNQDPRLVLFQKSYFNFIPSINYQIKF